MGSKMSFGRGSSDQNTVSELTSVASHPRSSIHAPSDCKQIPEDKRCGEEDLESRWGEEVKAKEPTQPAHESHSLGKLESEGLADSESNCSELVPSQEGMEAKSQLTSAIMCSSATDSHRHFMDGYKKRGRPRKMRSLLTENTNDPDSAALGAVQHEEISTAIPLPTCFENHRSEDVPKAVDCSLINNTPHNEMSGSHTVIDDKVEDYVSALPKRRRGRPRKSEIAAFKVMVANAAAAGATVPANNVSGPARRLRSRAEQQPLRQDEKTETEMGPTESHNTLNLQGIKRRRAKAADQQVPVKVSRLNLPPAPVVLSNYIGCEEKAEADKQVELNADKQGTDTDGKGNQLSPQSGKGQEQQTELKEGMLPQKRLCSQPPAEPEVIPLNSVSLVSPSQSDGPEIQQSGSMDGTEESLSKSSLESPKNTNMQNTEPSCTDVETSFNQPPKSVTVFPAVKSENVEVELAHFNTMSELNNPKSLQHSANTVQSEGPVYQRITFRRKRGGKRRRRISNVLLQTANPVDGHGGSSGTQQKTDCEDAEQEGNSNASANIIYIKRGGKTLLKCGFCGHIFKFMSQCIIHLRIHTGERPFKCPECGKGFTKNSNLNLHLKTHRKSNIYQKCPFCKIKFSCTEYTSHMKMHAEVLNHESEDNKSERRSKGNNHENSPGVQRPVSPEKREKKVCQYCGKTFPFQSALIRHVRVHTGEKPYKCDICGKAFGQAYFLRVHELTHWSVKRYNCTRCEKSFTHYSNAKNHTCRPPGGGDDLQPNRRVKPSLTYTCHICKNVFDHLQEFNSHMRAHTGAKLYRCLYCDKLFGVLAEFNSHHSQCGGERSTSSSAIKEEATMSLIQYTVPALRCSSGQNSAPLLTATNCKTQKKTQQTSRKKRCANLKKPFQSTVIPAHHLSHLVSKLNKLDNRSDPRKYLCPSCGRLFRHMGRLRAHMLTHAPGQSYTCACCGKTLESWKKLWHHQRIHRQRRGRFTCPQCGEGFRFVELYKKHMSEHPDFQWIQVRPKKVFLPYQCDQCRCSFKTLDLLFSHQLCHCSMHDVHKDSDFDLAIDDHTTQSNKKMFNPPTNNYMITSHPQPEENNLTLSPLPRNPDPVFQESPLDPMIPFVHNQSADLGKICQYPDSTHLIQDRETCRGKIEENALDRPITPLRTVRRHTTQNACISNEGSSDGVRCAVCGNAYPAISDLYHHYLQHARGQV